MSNSLNPHKVGLMLGGVLGLWHLTWSLLVAGGFAQPLLDLVFQLHMISPPYHVMAFSFPLAVGLIVFTSVFGYLIGFVAGWVWNAVQKK